MEGYWFFGLIVAGFLGLIPANIAKQKGYSFGAWWIYGWLLFIVAIIHVQFIPDRNLTQKNHQNQTVYSLNSKNDDQKIVDELKKYKELYDQGILTEEEFVIKKEQLLKLL